jgi:ArsR family transcriptional regulator
MDKNYKEMAQKLKALADETRLKIVDMLRDGELCACKIQESFHITQPTLSYHMKILTDCGLVSGRRDGAWIRYTLNKDGFKAICSVLEAVCEK